MEGAAPAAPATPAPSSSAPSSNGASAGAGQSAAPEAAVSGGAPAAPKAPPKPEAAEAKAAEDFFEVTIGKEKKRLTREEAQRRLQKELAGEARLRAASEKEKQLEERWNKLREAPDSVLSELGIDVEKLAEQRMAERARQSMMTPEERALAERDAQLADVQKQLKTYETEKKQAALAQRQEKLFQGFEKALLTAAESAQLAADPQTFVMLSEVANEFLELGLPLEPAHLAAEVKERQEKGFEAHAARVLANLSGPALLEKLGPKVVDEVLKAALAKAQKKNPYAPEQKADTPEATTPQPRQKKYVTEEEFNRKYGL